jgi:serine/threonine protein kinase
MLYGYNPFNNCKDITDLKKMLEKFVLKLPNINKGLSDSCISFIKLLLEKNNLKRISCNNMLIHEWLKDENKYLPSASSMNEINNLCIKQDMENDNKSEENQSVNSESEENTQFAIDY